MTLLQDMGLLRQGDSPESVLTDLWAQNRQALLPPVLVLSEENLVHPIPVRLDADEIGGALNYYLAADQGESFAGTIAEDELQPVDQPGADDPRQQFLFQLKKKLPFGYHRFILHTVKREASLRLIISPSSCYLPEQLCEKHRLWGLFLNLSSLCSESNWGIGDFSDLEKFIEMAAAVGADAIGLSPLHIHGRTTSLLASSRYFVDPLFTNLTRIPDYSAECFQDSRFSSLISTCRQAEGVDLK